MKRELICILCPRGCSLQVEINGDQACVKGNTCPKGEAYGIGEVTNPVRTVTSVVRVSNRPDTMVAVKTSVPVKKGLMFDVMEVIHNTQVQAPVAIGQVLVKDVCGADIIAAKEVV